jgi:sec-independent protein translocase protein TatB
VVLFIFESIGTSELILVGIVALIFLGPRKLPEMARKIGKMMAEFRSTTTEFKETWQREVNFEEEAKALNVTDIEAETVVRDPLPLGDAAEAPATPAIREVDPAEFEHALATDAAKAETKASPDTDDKANWL